MPLSFAIRFKWLVAFFAPIPSPCSASFRVAARRRALLIGINRCVAAPASSAATQDDQEAGSPTDSSASGQQVDDGELKGPHKDVKSIGHLLQEKYGYAAVDIRCLLDHPDFESPTRANIIKYIDLLVRDARPRDRFFFHFSGHSSQEDTDDIDEPDGKNEYILTCLNEKILDNELKELLVAPLPSGSSLTAVFDSCHSGTLLDLRHYLCNGIYLPYVNKGNRRTKDRWRRQGRKGAMFHDSGETATSTVDRQSISHLSRSSTSRSSPRMSASRTQSISHRPTSMLAEDRSLSLRTDLMKGNVVQFLDNPRIVDSPDQLYRYCDGFTCAKLHEGQSAPVNVISISSSADSQRTWEDKNGKSMTAALVQMLSDNAHPPLRHILTTISFQLHASCLVLHQDAVKFRKRLRKFNERRRKKLQEAVEEPDILPEMVNFQVPQLSSEYPLPPDQVWDP